MSPSEAAFSLAQALATPFLGYLSDRFGRRPVTWPTFDGPTDRHFCAYLRLLLLLLLLLPLLLPPLLLLLLRRRLRRLRRL